MITHVSKLSVEGAVEHGLEEIFGAAAAGGLGGLHFADFLYAFSKVLLRSERWNWDQ